MTPLTEAYASPAPTVPPTALRQVVLVAAGPSLLGIPLERCREILAARSYTPLPGSAAWVPGMFNLRGRLVTVCDLSAWLRQPAATRADHSVVVVEYGGKQVGLAVDGVLRMISFEPRVGEEEDEPLYPVRLGDGADGELRLFALLDPDRILGPALG